jgi:hypothetical protein
MMMNWIRKSYQLCLKPLFLINSTPFYYLNKNTKIESAI